MKGSVNIHKVIQSHSIHIQISTTLLSLSIHISRVSLKASSWRANNQRRSLLKEEKKERQSEIVYVSGLMTGGVIYLEHLWRISGLPGRQPWPDTALSSCLSLKDQQRINHSKRENVCKKQIMAVYCHTASALCGETGQHMQRWIYVPQVFSEWGVRTLRGS